MRKKESMERTMFVLEQADGKQNCPMPTRDRKQRPPIWGIVFSTPSFLPVVSYLYSPQYYKPKYLVLVATATAFKDAKL